MSICTSIAQERANAWFMRWQAGIKIVGKLFVSTVPWVMHAYGMLDSTRYKNSDALFVQCFSVDRKVPVPELRGKKITPFPKTVKCTTLTRPTAVAGKGSLPFLGKNHSTSHRTQFLWAVCSQSPASGSLFLVKGRGEWIDSPGLGLHVLRSALCSTRKSSWDLPHRGLMRSKEKPKTQKRCYFQGMQNEQLWSASEISWE